ncbi:MAG: RDD family protein [Bdellovibrionaceae bacterium]|nr:RDD family protein [Pseudobdellovibrionaceae bacterium]
MNNNIDPFEEFEFKPITEGLGFHRESKKNNSSATSSAVSASTIPASPKSSSILFEPVIASSKKNLTTTTVKNTDLEKNIDVVDEILRNIQSTKKINSELSKSLNNKIDTKPKALEYKKSNALLSAIFLDTLLVVASTLLCLVLLLAVTKIDLLGNLRNPDEEGFIYISTFLLLLSVGFIYYTCYRAFIGSTPGEWAYDQKLQPKGNDSEAIYILKIILRSLVTIFTGIIFLPMISWILKKDLVGELIGLNLIRKEN